MWSYNFEYFVRAHSDNSNICIVDGGVRKKAHSTLRKCVQRRSAQKSAFRPTRLRSAIFLVVRRFELQIPLLTDDRIHGQPIHRAGIAV